MSTFLVTRDVVVDDETIAPVHFTIEAVNGPTAAKHADRGKRAMEAEAGTAPAVSNRESAVGDHLYDLPFAGLSKVLFPNRKVKSRKRNARKRNNKSK